MSRGTQVLLCTKAAEQSAEYITEVFSSSMIFSQHCIAQHDSDLTDRFAHVRSL